MTALRRLLGGALVATTLLPLHLLLDPERAGPAGAATRAIGEGAAPMLRWGTLFLLATAGILATLVPAGGVARRLRRAGDRLAAVSPTAWAVATGTVALTGGLAVALLVLRGTPTLLDEMVQLLHARALAEGRIALPLPDPAAARLVQNGLVTPAGWASVYPPGHTALLALGLVAGVPWIVGPVLAGLTAAFAALAFERLLPERPRTARVAGLLVATSPFLLALGGSYLSHTSAAAFGAAAFLAALLARDGRARWAAAAGLAMGVMVAARPWTGLTLGTALTAGVWLAAWRRGARPRGWLRLRTGLWMAGGLPAAVAVAAWNTRLFGDAMQLGYGAAFGPAHGLGLHRDPWGNLYGLEEAVAYTGFDLTTLGLHLLETPLPLVTVVGVWLLLAPRLPRGSGPLLAWALVPVAANALYWHHGYHMGPRMLYAAAPGWLGLVALALVGLAGEGEPAAPAEAGDHGRGRGARRRLRDGVVWLAVLLPVAGALQTPARLASYRPGPAYLAASRPLRPPDPRPAVVFVHGSWAGRVAARLAQAGMRRDSIETALRRNALCRVHLYAEERRGGDPVFDASLPALDLTPAPGMPTGLRVVEQTPGDLVKVEPGAPLHPSCVRELASDRLGVAELAPLLWRTALPGDEGGVLLARDLGPAANRRFLESVPGRIPWLWVPGREAGDALLPYEEGERLLWGEDGGGGGPAMSQR